MCLLHAIRRILCCGQDDEDQRFHDNRNYRYYSSISPPLLPSRSNPLDRSKTKLGDPTQHPRFCDDARALLSPGRPPMYSSGNLKPPPVISHCDGNRTIFSATGSLKKPDAVTTICSFNPSLSSSVSAASSSGPSIKPSFTAVLSSNSNIPVIGISNRPQKLQITKDSSTCLPDKPHAALLLPKLQPPSISSSATPPSSKNLSAAILSAEKSPVSGNPVGPSKLQISRGPATRSPERSDAITLLLKSPSSSVSPSDCNSPSPQSIASSSKKPSSCTLSCTTSSIPGAPSKVWQPKLPIPLDSTTLVAEKIFSPSLRNKDTVSHIPPLPSPSPISNANTSFYGDGDRVWRKKQSSADSSRETLPSTFSLFQTSLKVSTYDSSSSEGSPPSSEASSPLSSLEPQISNPRVLQKYQIPKYLEEMIKKDIVPPVLSCPLSPSTYGDYFATLLYAEDFYLEKWSEYLLEDVMLELRPRIGPPHSREINMKIKNTMEVPEDFVAFKIDSVPEKRPYLLSRDFVFLQPLNSTAGPFKGILFRVVKSVILVEFGDDFHSQHSPSKRYNVSFSFNRVCLKRAHQAISIATDPSFRSILFPDESFSPQPSFFHLHETVLEAQDPVTRIANHKGPIPYLIQGHLSLTKERPVYRHDEEFRLTLTGNAIVDAIRKIYRANPHCRVLVCSPTNKTSDELLRKLSKLMPAASVFRANAAFRDYNLVPEDIVPASLYEEEEECFSCPPLAELLNFNVITCTYISSFRLYSAGIDSDHFSHIFLVDACLVIEPEAIVPLANLADKSTAIVVTGCTVSSPGWVRSEIARRCGLKASYFSRLLRCEPYRSRYAMFFVKIE